MPRKTKTENKMSTLHKVDTQLYKALKSKYESDRDAGLATLQVYFNNPVGIGEHPQVVEEMTKQLELVSSAEDNLQTLVKYFPNYESEMS